MKNDNYLSESELSLKALIDQTAEMLHAQRIYQSSTDGFSIQLSYTATAEGWPYRSTLWLRYSRTEEALSLKLLPASAKPVETADEQRQALLLAAETLAETPVSLSIRHGEIYLHQNVSYPCTQLTTCDQLLRIISDFGRYAREVVQTIDDRIDCLVKPQNPKPAAPVLRYTPEQKATITMLEQWLVDDIQEWDMRAYDATMRAYYFIGHLSHTGYALHFTIRPLFGPSTYLLIEVEADRRVKADTLKSDDTVAEAVARFNRTSPFRAKISPLTGRLSFKATLTEKETTRDGIAKLVDGLCSSMEADDICALLANRNNKPTLRYSIKTTTESK